MRSAAYNFFMTPSEFLQMIWEIVDELEVVVVLQNTSGAYGARELPRDRSTLVMSRGQRANILELVRPDEVREGLNDAARVRPGWVYCDTPAIYPSGLRMARLVYTTSDDLDAETAGREVATIRSLYRKVLYRLKKRLRFPTWSVWLATGNVSRIGHLGHGADVATWQAAGGELWDGRRTVRYFARDPTGTEAARPRPVLPT